MAIMCSFTGSLKASRWEGSRLFLLVYQTTFDPVAMVSLSFLQLFRWPCPMLLFSPFSSIWFTPLSCELCVLTVSSRLHLTSFPRKNKGYVPLPLVKEISKESTFPDKNDLFTACESLHFEKVLQKWWLNCYKYLEILCLTLV